MGWLRAKKGIMHVNYGIIPKFTLIVPEFLSCYLIVFISLQQIEEMIRVITTKRKELWTASKQLYPQNRWFLLISSLPGAPCKMMHPVLEGVKEQMGDKVRILKVDVDKNEALSEQYRIQSVPTLMLFKDGEMVWRQSGAMTKADLIQVINQY